MFTTKIYNPIHCFLIHIASARKVDTQRTPCLVTYEIIYPDDMKLLLDLRQKIMAQRLQEINRVSYTK